MKSIFGFLLKNLPHIIGAVVAVENAITAPGQTKKELVMNAIAVAAQAGEKMSDAHVSAISTAIDSTVATLNASGIFSSKSKDFQK